MMNPRPMIPSQSTSLDSATLPLVRAELFTSARGGLARVRLVQEFRNDHAEPLCVTYKLPLPADAAVAGYRFKIGDRVVQGQVDKKHAARERFQEALANGQTAALLEEDRSSMFTQELGNVPPGARVTVEISLDQPLRFLDEGQWEWRFPLAAAPRYLGQEGRVRDSGRMDISVAEALPVRASMTLEVCDALPEGRSPESPSHPLQCERIQQGHRVAFGSGGAVPLDRDVVVRWDAAGLSAGVTAHVAPPTPGLVDSHALVTLVPPQRGRMPNVPRDLTILLDTSGSMSGDPIDQAKRVSMALLAGLSDTDQFEIIEFSHRPQAFASAPMFATKANKARAFDWLRGLRAGGGTEMRDGIMAALAPLRAESQKQVVLVTDGLIGFEAEIVSTLLHQMPARTRLHTVGVGSSVNRTLTTGAARAGRGIEVILGLGEDPERAAERLRARTELPLITEVTVAGDALLELAPACVPDLFAGAPVLLSARVRSTGGELVLRGRTREGHWEQRVRIPAQHAQEGGPEVRTLFGREAIADAEMRLAAGESAHEVDARIESLGLAYQIASRLTSWVAVDANVSVDPTKPTRRVDMPQALPYGMSAEGLGLRAPSSQDMTMVPMAPRAAAAMPMMHSLSSTRAGGAPPPPAASYGMPPAPGAPPPPPAQAPQVSKAVARPSMGRAMPPATGAPPPPAAPAPKRAEKKESEGLIDRLRGMFSPRDTEAPAPEEEEASAVFREEAAPAPTLLRARLVLSKDGEIIIEITLNAPLEWDFGQPTLHFASGAIVRADIDWKRSTAPGAFAPGMVVRVAMTFASTPVLRSSQLSQVVFDLPGGTLLVSLSEP